jgi:hypothetical protein
VYLDAGENDIKIDLEVFGAGGGELDLSGSEYGLAAGSCDP